MPVSTSYFTEKEIRSLKLSDLSTDFIKDAKLQYFKDIGYIPTPGQMEVHMSTAQFRILFGGTRFGKSMCAANDFGAYLMMGFPFRFWIVAPSYDLGAREFEYLWENIVNTLRAPCKKHVFNKRGGYMLIHLEWDAWIEVRSAQDEDLLYGEMLDGCIMAEASKIKRSVFEDVIFGRLVTRKGQLFIPTTPKREEWVNELWEMGQDPEQKDYKSWTFATWDNEHAPKDMIAKAKEILPERLFRREYGGEPIAVEGNIYEFDEKNIVESFPGGGEYPPFNWPVYRVIDFGYQSAFVCLFIALEILPDGSERDWIFLEHYAKQMLLKDHAEIINELSEPFASQIECTYGDTSGGGAQDIAEIAEYIPDIMPVRKDKDFYMSVGRSQRQINLLWKDKKPFMLTMEWCVNTIREHKKYKWAEDKSKSDKNLEDKPRKLDDHTCDAYRYYRDMRRFGDVGVMEIDTRPETFIEKAERIKKARDEVQNPYDFDAFLIKYDNLDRLDTFLRMRGAMVAGLGVPGGPIKIDDSYLIKCQSDMNDVKRYLISLGAQITREMKRAEI